jgi:hypothetical protein
MKIIAFLVVMFIAEIAAASEKIDIVNGYRIGGLNHKTSEYIQKSFPDVFNDLTNVGNCADAVNILKNTSKPTIAVWSISDTATAPDKACSIANEENFLTVYSNAYYSVCSLKTNDENDLEKLLSGESKIGLANFILAKTQLEKALSEIKSNSSMIPYGTSSDMLAALEIGEIDFVYTGRINENMNCVLTNDPNAQNIAKMSDYFDGPFTEFGNTISVIAVNVDKAYVKKLIYGTYKNENWSDVFKGYNNEISKMLVNEQYKKINDEIKAFLDILE